MKALRACETPRRHRISGHGNPGSKWLSDAGKTPKGKEPQGRQLLRASALSNGTRAGLWRGAKGQERIFQGSQIPWKAGWAKTSKTSASQGHRGSEETNTVANPTGDNTLKAS
jgi:hypothetical protein